MKKEVSRLETQLRSEMGQYVNQFAQQLAPMAISSYKQQHFSTPLMQQAAPEFDKLLQQEMQVNPAVVNNPQALDTLRTLALGRALENGSLQVGQQTRQMPFSESPGAPIGFAPQVNPQAPTQAIKFAELLGIKPEVTNTIHSVFEKNGVYRNE